MQDIISVLMSIQIADILDIAIVSYLLYKVLGFIRETRALQLVKGIVILMALFVLSSIFHLSLLNWLLKSLVTVGMFAVVVIFQPELRRGLEKVGQKTFLSGQRMNMDKDEALAVVAELTDAIDELSATRTGGLMAFEKNTRLNDIIESGNVIDAKITARLIGNLFYEGSPLHDGAVIVRNDRIAAASCVLPLTDKHNIGRNLGTRHRAAVGLSEVCDALIIVVSEETGAISIAHNGMLKRFLDIKTVEKALMEHYIPHDKAKSSVFKEIFGGRV